VGGHVLELVAKSFPIPLLLKQIVFFQAPQNLRSTAKYDFTNYVELDTWLDFVI
jgi:hypothetical protein